MPEAERALASLLWVGDLNRHDTVAVCWGSIWLLLEVAVVGGERFLSLRRRADVPDMPVEWAPTHTIPGVLHGICPSGQPLWYMRKHLFRYLIDMSHAV